MDPILLWVIISIAALVIDIITSSFFIAGFTIGGIFAIITQTLGGDMPDQIFVFGVASVLAIMVEYMWFRKKIKKSIPKTPRMEEEYIGREITAEEDIDKQGRIKVDGIYWTVQNEGSKVEKGEKVKIVGIRGNKLLIKK
ncbi:MAG TPA: nodulation efficiency protein D [Clostridiaceae bacterium]|nr:nodulation efficiency protein D [Clostridiaceae bacterium]